MIGVVTYHYLHEIKYSQNGIEKVQNCMCNRDIYLLTASLLILCVMYEFTCPWLLLTVFKLGLDELWYEVHKMYKYGVCCPFSISINAYDPCSLSVIYDTSMIKG